MNIKVRRIVDVICKGWNNFQLFWIFEFLEILKKKFKMQKILLINCFNFLKFSKISNDLKLPIPWTLLQFPPIIFLLQPHLLDFNYHHLPPWIQIKNRTWILIVLLMSVNGLEWKWRERESSSAISIHQTQAWALCCCVCSWKTCVKWIHKLNWVAMCVSYMRCGSISSRI